MKPSPDTAVRPPAGRPINPQSLRLSAAFGLAATAMLIPANVLPIMSMNLIGLARTDTIWSGVVELAHGHMWGIAGIVFIASLAVPILKLVSLGLLLWAGHHPHWGDRRKLTKLYHVVHFIGRWSMLDIFLVAFLCGTVQFGALAQVTAEMGAFAFAAVVILTMLATTVFDPRLLWPPAQTSPSAQ